MDQNIRVFIHKLRRRLGLQKAISIFPIFLSLGFFIAFLHVLFGFFYPFYYAGILSLFWISFSFLSGGIYFLLHFPKERETAHIGDSVIGQERLLTSLDLRGNDTEISCLQKEDTIRHITKCNIKEAFPFKLPAKQMLAFLFTVFFFFIFFLFPSNAKLKAVKLHELKQEAKTEAKLLEDVTKELEQEIKAEEVSPEIAETVGKKLEEYGKLEKVEQALEQAKKEYSSASSKQDLQKAKERLKVKLKNMAENTTSADEQKALSDLMERAGLSGYHSEHNSNDNTTSSEGEKDNTNNSNSENKEETDTNSQANNGTVSDNNSSQNTENSNNNTNNNNNSTNSNNNNNNSNSQNTNNNNNNNKDNNSSNNQSSNNNTTTNNSNKNSNQSGNSNSNGKKSNSNNDTGTGKNHGSKNGVEHKSKKSKEKEKIMVTHESIGDDENLTGDSSEYGSSYEKSSEQQLNFGTKENLEDVAGDYAKNAITSINNSSIPYYMKDIVKDYFNHIS